MKILHKSAASITIQVSRSNLQALLAKLDGHPGDSPCVILRYDQSAQCYLRIQAVEDGEHYQHRDRGLMHTDTEAAMEAMTDKCVVCDEPSNSHDDESCPGTHMGETEFWNG